MTKPVQNNSKLLYTKAKQIFEKASAKFEDGTIHTEPKLISSVFSAFQEFFTSMGSPHMKTRFAPEDGPLWSEDFNNMMSEIRLDLELLFNEVDLLGKSLYTDFNHNMVQKDILSKQFESTLDKLRDLELYEGLNQDDRMAFGRDDFLNKSKIDYSRIQGLPLEVTNGAVTLPEVSRTNVAETAAITIISGNRKKDTYILGTESNGFPGNNTEIQSMTDDVLTNRNYIPTFLGESNNHGDYSAVLDGMPNTWFEYEKVNIREHDKISVAKNIGWDYQVYDSQTTRWAEDPDDGTLKLHMQMVLEKETVINQINCNMYTPPGYGAKTAIVKNILVSDGKTAPVSIMPKDKKKDQYNFHFAPIKAKIISIIFEQPHKYLTDIGHIFYEKKMQVEDAAEYAMDMATKKQKYAPRTEGPLISLEDLGVKVNVDQSNVSATYPLVRSGEGKTTNIGETINRLYSSADLDTVDIGVEKFEGFRWVIGIRDIEVYSCEYAEQGELVTVPFYFDKPLDKVTIDVNDIVPTASSTSGVMKSRWMTYFVSIDDGAMWHPITPIHHQTNSPDDPPKIYTIRSVEKQEQILDNKKEYLESEHPVYSLRLKIVVTRPEEEGEEVEETFSAIQRTPIISSYAFSAQVINDAADSEESDITDAGLSSIGDGIDTGIEEPPPYSPPPVVEQPKPPVGGPDEDDDGDGVPNRNDAEWKPPLTVELTNKKTRWCVDEDMLVKARVYSSSTVTKLEVYLNGTLHKTIALSGKIADTQLTIPHAELFIGTLTIGLKGFDSKGFVMTNHVTNIIDCTDIPDEDRPREDDTITKISLKLDSKPTSICECETIQFYGAVQGPNQIQSVLFELNGLPFDPDNMGARPSNDPCAAIGMSLAEAPRLLSAMDSSVVAFEQEEDCGCSGKTRAPEFQMQSTPSIMAAASYEQSFQVSIPYWKLMQLNGELGKETTITVIAMDTTFAEARSTFTVQVKDCEKPSEDEFGNPRVRDCYQLESVSLSYYDFSQKSVVTKTIPRIALPYSGISNGMGSEVTIGWNTTASAPVVMLTKGYDESGSIFQIHAVGLNYTDEYDKPLTIWTQTIGETSGKIVHHQKMVGDNTRETVWTADIENGDYSTAPAIGSLNGYVTFLMSNEWITKSCDVTIPDFEPEEHKQPEEPESDQIINACNKMTHVIFQVFDETNKALRMYKVDITGTGKDMYTITTSNGAISLIVGWANYFKGPVIQIKGGAGSNNVLLTAVAVLYIDQSNRARTHWVESLRFKTGGVRYPEFVLSGEKEISQVGWVSNGTVDYSQATYVGGLNDLVAFSVSEEIATNTCQPENAVDDDIGIDPTSPPDKPTITYMNAPQTICVEEGIIEVVVKVEDLIQLKEVEYSVTVNDIPLYGPYIDSIDSATRDIALPVDTYSLVAGDTVKLITRVTNSFGEEVEETKEILAENCDTAPPVVVTNTTMTKSEEAYCYTSLVNGKIPITVTVTDDKRIASWTVSAPGFTETMDYIELGEIVDDTGVMNFEVPVSLATTTDEYNRTYIPNREVRIVTVGVDKTDKTTTQELVIAMTDCTYDSSPPFPKADVSGTVVLDATVSYSNAAPISMGNFMTEWTQWHRDPAGPGSWSTVTNAGRTELTNSVNQATHSGWYNQAHMSAKDYFFQASYQMRGTDDDMVGLFFRVQPGVAGFYSVEHDGGGSHVNGPGFFLNRYDGTTKTVLASSADNWVMNANRAYKVEVTLSGNRITVELYGDAVTTRPAGEAAPEPVNWVHIKTLSAEDSTYTTGAWGPITASQPDTYFWNLEMRDIQKIDNVSIPALEKSLSIDKTQYFEVADANQEREITIVTTTTEQLFATSINQALAGRGITMADVLSIDYRIKGAMLIDVEGASIPLVNTMFVPSDGVTPQETRSKTAVVKVLTMVKF